MFCGRSTLVTTISIYKLYIVIRLVPQDYNNYGLALIMGWHRLWQKQAFGKKLFLQIFNYIELINNNF